MFYTIHRAVKFLLLCVVLGIGWKIYERRAMFEPALIWYDVWENGGFNAPKVEIVSGRVLHVLNSQTFLLAPKKGARLNVRLMGLRDPNVEISIEAQEKERIRREALQELVQDKWVHVELQYQNANNIGGVVFINGQNLNAELVRRGLANSSIDLIKGFPKETQYTMLWSLRHRTRIF